MRKPEFQRLVKSLKGSWGYKYTIGNDEYRTPNWQRRTADYTFSLVNAATKQEITILSGRTGKDRHQHNEELIKKYSRWARETKEGN